MDASSIHPSIHPIRCTHYFHPLLFSAFIHCRPSRPHVPQTPHPCSTSAAEQRRGQSGDEEEQRLLRHKCHHGAAREGCCGSIYDQHGALYSACLCMLCRRERMTVRKAVDSAKDTALQHAHTHDTGHLHEQQSRHRQPEEGVRALRLQRRLVSVDAISVCLQTKCFQISVSAV